MSVKIRVSYENEDELYKIVSLLHQYIKQVKISKVKHAKNSLNGSKNTYKRAYIDLKNIPTNAEKQRKNADDT